MMQMTTIKSPGCKAQYKLLKITGISKEVFASIFNMTNIKLEAASSSEMVVPSHQFTIRHITED
jgi:hypothetical protein